MAFSIDRLLFLEQTKRQFLLLAIDGVFSHTSNTFSQMFSVSAGRHFHPERRPTFLALVKKAILL
jgi:hypothetical protein